MKASVFYDKRHGSRIVTDEGPDVFAGFVVMENVTFKIDENKRRGFLETGTRNRHAWAEGQIIAIGPAEDAPATAEFGNVAQYDRDRGAFMISENIEIASAAAAVIIGKNIFVQV